MKLMSLGLGFMALPLALGSGDSLLAVIILGVVALGVALDN